MLVSLDVETKCKLECPTKCDHALVPQTSLISCVGIYSEKESKVFRDLEELKVWVENHPFNTYVGHNFKFDLHQLYEKGVKIPLRQWVHDTQIMAHASIQKIPDNWMESYSAKREVANAALPKGYSHRAGGRYSLKCLAPYFLGINPFWENPMDHDNDEYVIKDCEYTYKLCQIFLRNLQKEDVHEFYEKYLFAWNKMLFETERRGISIDKDLLLKLEMETDLKLEELTRQLRIAWHKEITEYETAKARGVFAEYEQKAQAAIAKRKKQSIEKISEKYLELCRKNLEKNPPTFNFSSPKQMTWLFKTKGYDIKNLEGEEETGKGVLNRLASEGHEDIQIYLKYREQEKLKTAFYPNYRERTFNGVIHGSYNITGTRTGRLSANSPNLQQVKGSLHELFVARKGYKFVTRDLSAIEPRLIAYYSEDPLLCKIVLEERDFHSINAKIMCELDSPENEIKDKHPAERKLAKTCGLALLYGAGTNRIQQSAISVGFAWTEGKCRQIYQNFKRNYEELFRYKAALDDYAKSNPIVNLFGRRHTYPDPEEIHMKTFNTLIQSSASDLLLEGARRAYNRFREEGVDAIPLLFVHDEVVFEVPEEKVKYAEEVIEQSITQFNLKTKWGNIPLKCEGKTDTVWSK